ncbi:DUF5677 domain-containing protein [Phytohabitans suffuscus]|uniref:DUF5677 domain-containing protein n=1 Tax=Phytohabitans suffuscus TaxID=624315 RepID=UPI0015670F67|nr:DUF5677 domain-containing protein [Phytohabitans suffuscus]
MAEDAYDYAVQKGLAHDQAVDAAVTAVLAQLPKMIGPLAASLHRSAPELVENLANDRLEIISEISKRWGRAFLTYEAAGQLAFEIGAKMYDLVCQHDDEPLADDEISVDLISLLYGRACTVSGEVLCLMQSGFPEGAAARQRTLHELAVVITLIVDHADLGLAKRYADYSYVEQRDDMVQYQRHTDALGLRPLDTPVVAEIEANYRNVLAQYGEHFRRRNRWAAPLFSAGEDITFVKLEDKAGLSHLRPMYGYSNHHVHAGARAAILNLHETRDWWQIGAGAREDVDLAGVGHAALVSLLQCTAPLLKSTPGALEDPDHLLQLQVLSRLVEDAGLAFRRAAVKSM